MSDPLGARRQLPESRLAEGLAAIDPADRPHLERLRQQLLDACPDTSRESAEALREKLEAAYLGFIHDPQLAALLGPCPELPS